MKKLFMQMVKFGLVGFICFIIDWLVGLIVSNIIFFINSNASDATVAVIASAIGFSVSVIVNYILSFKFVFKRKEDMNRGSEFVAFIILSIIGLGLNSLIIGIWMKQIYTSISFLQKFSYNLNYTAAKILATAIVMVYNFVTRKIFLEEKNQEEN